MNSTLEPLEPRFLLNAADVSIRLNGSGRLIVGGTQNDDHITIYRRSRDKHIVVRVNDFVRSFHRSRVHAASIYGYGGDDVIDVSRSKKTYHWADGGAGNDTMIGGIGVEAFYGGDGNDSLTGDTNTDKLFGGDGNDVIVGGGGSDYIDGGAQRDILLGSAGIDTIKGAGGNDYIHGGGDEADLIFGGAGNDTASHDPHDSFNSIEILQEPVF